MPLSTPSSKHDNFLNPSKPTNRKWISCVSYICWNDTTSEERFSNSSYCIINRLHRKGLGGAHTGSYKEKG